MDPDSHLLMQQFVGSYGNNIPESRVLEVGSQDINGNPRGYFQLAKEYIGVDVLAGPMVDMILQDPNKLPFPDNHFDYVISQNCLEHAPNFWLVAKEMARVLKPGGFVCITVPWRFQVHKDALCPVDCYRILDDGMRALIQYTGLTCLEARMYQDFTIGVGQKI